jgi:hypothetical protein
MAKEDGIVLPRGVEDFARYKAEMLARAWPEGVSM